MTHDDAEAAIARAPLDSGDHRLLSGVRELFSLVDPPPASLADSIKFELTLAALHAEVAELEQLSFVGLREDRVDYVPTESVTFTSSSLSLMVTVSPKEIRPPLRPSGSMGGSPRAEPPWSCGWGAPASPPSPMRTAGSSWSGFPADRPGSSCAGRAANGP